MSQRLTHRVSISRITSETVRSSPAALAIAACQSSSEMRMLRSGVPLDKVAPLGSGGLDSTFDARRFCSSRSGEVGDHAADGLRSFGDDVGVFVAVVVEVFSDAFDGDSCVHGLAFPVGCQYTIPNYLERTIMADKYHRCEAEGCDLLSLMEDYCVAHREDRIDCRECGWVHTATAPCPCPPDAECDCCALEYVPPFVQCEDAPCCGCCDPGRAVMPG